MALSCSTGEGLIIGCGGIDVDHLGPAFPLVEDPFSNTKTRVSDFAYGFFEHSGRFYGQLSVYYRVAALVPPESRPKK